MRRIAFQLALILGVVFILGMGLTTPRTARPVRLPLDPDSSVLLPGSGAEPLVLHGTSNERGAASLETLRARAGNSALDRIPSPITSLGSTSAARYSLRDGNVRAFFSDRGIAFSLMESSKPRSPGGTTQGWGLHWGLVGASAVEPRPGAEMPARVNHLVGSPSQWQTGAKAFGSLVYGGVQPGVDLSIESRPHGLEYSLRLPAGSDTHSLRLRYEGAQRVEAVSGGGAIEISTPLGILREDGLVCYQEGPTGRQPVEARYSASGGEEYSIELGAFDPSLELIVDPTISWSTLLGGSGYDNPVINSFVLKGGYIYVTGTTASPDFPVPGGYQVSLNGPWDAFIAKINSTDMSLVWATYLGGSGVDGGGGIAVDPSGNVYVCGGTNSTDFPVLGGFQMSSGGGWDSFVAKLDPSGSNLIWSSYLGATGEDDVHGLGIDNGGNVYVIGHTWSPDFPTLNAIQSAFGGGPYDGFITKINASGSSLAWSTFMGPGALQVMQVDGAGNVTAAGMSFGGAPILGGFQPAFGSGSYHGYVASVSPAGTLVWSSFLGGSGNEQIYGVFVDAVGTVYLSGQTSSPDFPVPGGFQTTFAGYWDGFVTKVNPGGASLAWSSYFGGNNYEAGRGIAADAAGNVYVTGPTLSLDFPVSNGFQMTYGGGSADAFVMKVNASGSSVAWSSYLGGNGNDDAYAVALDSSGNIYLLGGTESTDFPVTPGALRSTLGGPWDTYLVKIAADPVPPRPVTELQPARVWLGLKNSDDVGIKFDLRAEAYKVSGGVPTLIGVGELASVPGGSSGFNNAKLQQIPLSIVGTPSVASGDVLSIKVLVRNAASGSGKNSGTARLWFNDSQADSRFGIEFASPVTINSYYLLDAFSLGSAAGSGPRKTIDVAAGAKGSAFKSFGTWSTTFP